MRKRFFTLKARIRIKGSIRQVNSREKMITIHCAIGRITFDLIFYPAAVLFKNICSRAERNMPDFILFFHGIPPLLYKSIQAIAIIQISTLKVNFLFVIILSTFLFCSYILFKVYNSRKKLTIFFIALCKSLCYTDHKVKIKSAQALVRLCIIFLVPLCPSMALSRSLRGGAGLISRLIAQGFIHLRTDCIANTLKYAYLLDCFLGKKMLYL